MNNSLTLYDISGRFYELMARMNADETLTEQEADEQYNELTALLQQKTPGIVAYYRNMTAMIEAIKTEETRLAEMRKRAEKAQENYKNYIMGCMKRMDIISIETPLGKLKIAKNPASVEVTDIKQIPDDFVNTSVRIICDRAEADELLKKYDSRSEATYTADKNAIKKHFSETGEILPGTNMQTGNERLDIK